MLLRGWKCTGEIQVLPETRDQWMYCEMCEREKIRYVHTMERIDKSNMALVSEAFNDGIIILEEEVFPKVGCICAGWLTGFFDRHALSRMLSRWNVLERETARETLKKLCVCAESRAKEEARRTELRRQANLGLPPPPVANGSIRPLPRRPVMPLRKRRHITK